MSNSFKTALFEKVKEELLQALRNDVKVVKFGKVIIGETGHLLNGTIEPSANTHYIINANSIKELSELEQEILFVRYVAIVKKLSTMSIDISQMITIPHEKISLNERL